MGTLNYIDENGNINKAGVIPKNYPASNISYNNETVKSKLDSLTTDVSGKVSKSGDTMTGDLLINCADGTSSANGSSDITLGNSTPSGTEGNSRGRVTLYGTGANYARLIADPTANRTLTLPDKTGTLATTDDISSRIGGYTYSYFSMNSGSNNAYIKNFNLSEESIFIVFSIVPGSTHSALSIITWNTTTVTESQIGAYALSPTIVGSGDSRAIQLSGKRNWGFFYIVSNHKFTYANSL